MSTATRHAARRESPLARLTRLARRYATDTAETPADPCMPVPPGMPGPDAAEAPSHWAEEHHEDPHGIARPEVLAALVAEAHASPVRPATMLAPVSIAETESWGPWDKPDGLLMDERDEYATPSRPYIPEPAPWYPPLSAEENRERMRKVVYPRPGGFPEQYAAVMWQVSAATGTTGLRERPAAWPRHEIEAPRGAAA